MGRILENSVVRLITSQRGVVEIPKPDWRKKHCTGRAGRKPDKLVLSLMSMVRFIISPV